MSNTANNPNTTTSAPKIKKKIKPNTRLAKPPEYKVIFYNDDITTHEFVIETLINIFSINFENACDITSAIEDEGSAVVAILPFEIAEQKAIESTILARMQNFPLHVDIQPDE